MQDYKIRLYKPGDEGALSALIIRGLMEVNSKDYDMEEMQHVASGYRAEDIVRIASDGPMYVAEGADGTLLGCGALAPHQKDPDAVWIHAVFTLPEYLGKGIGQSIMAALEADPMFTVAARGAMDASLTGEPFYLKLGYTYEGGTRTVAEFDVIPMEKRNR